LVHAGGRSWHGLRTRARDRWAQLTRRASPSRHLSRDLLIVLGLVVAVGVAQAVVVHNQARLRAQTVDAESATSTTAVRPARPVAPPATKALPPTTAAPTTTVAPNPQATERAFCAAARTASGSVGQELDVLFGGGPLGQPLGAQYGMHLVQATWPLGDKDLTAQAQKVRTAIVATAHGLPGGGGARYDPALLRTQDVVWAAAAIDAWANAHCGPVAP
jgi:hypothetical protein